MIGELSRRERQIMDVLFRRGEATVAEVMQEMPDPPSYSAVRATLRILEEKGHVVHRQDGPRYVYLPAVAPEEAREDALRHLVRTFFHGSAESAAVALLRMSDTELTDEDIARLARKIRDAAKEGR
ncbi:MAG TPA: BlaI/MecI/CopY family transcriptional regulator [Longimicrobiales bacterium]